jgi:hypothetical protein
MPPDLPTFDLLIPFRQLARVPPHRGTASFKLGEEAFYGSAEFLLPAGGQPIIAFHASAGLTSEDFGSGFVIDGEVEAGSFRIECAQVFVATLMRAAPGT